MKKTTEWRYSWIEVGGQEIDLWVKLKYTPFYPGATDGYGRKIEPDEPEGYHVEDVQWLDPNVANPEFETAPDLIYNLIAEHKDLEQEIIDRALGDWRERRAS